MAQKTITIYTDDLTGEEAQDAATHTLALDGVVYEIDLGPDSYDNLLEAIAPFTRVGRRVGSPRRSAGRRKDATATDTAAIREWARENGFEVNERGRVPAALRDAYQKAVSP
ncbi:Lsr2 family protein [Streptomyces collinus]|uniref:histone-like nucleoid-structuring protein Lsr2 n=1 Tax=Streptomyces collinus TaxID=42684 RepID=UPI00368D30C2